MRIIIITIIIIMIMIIILIIIIIITIIIIIPFQQVKNEFTKYDQRMINYYANWQPRLAGLQPMAAAWNSLVHYAHSMDNWCTVTTPDTHVCSPFINAIFKWGWKLSTLLSEHVHRSSSCCPRLSHGVVVCYHGAIVVFSTIFSNKSFSTLDVFCVLTVLLDTMVHQQVWDRASIISIDRTIEHMARAPGPKFTTIVLIGDINVTIEGSKLTVEGVRLKKSSHRD